MKNKEENHIPDILWMTVQNPKKHKPKDAALRTAGIDMDDGTCYVHSSLGSSKEKNFYAAAMDGNVKRLQAFLKQYNPTLDCKGCVVSFAPSVGHGGTVAGFAGSLVEMCQANAGEQVDCGSYNE